MTKLELASTRPIDPGRRVDVAEKVRRGANSIATQGRRIGDVVGRIWTTESSEAEMIESLVRLACDALTLREELMRVRAARKIAEEDS